MLRLNFEASAALVAFVISTAFILWPRPYLMLLFTFVAVPLFLMAGLFYLAHVVRELRRKDVL